MRNIPMKQETLGKVKFWDNLSEPMKTKNLSSVLKTSLITSVNINQPNDTSTQVYLVAKSLCWKILGARLIDRSSRPEVFCKKGVFRIFTKFTGKHMCQSIFFNEVADLRPATLLKTRLWHKCFPVNFDKFLRTPFYIEHPWWLLLDWIIFEIESSNYSPI